MVGDVTGKAITEPTPLHEDSRAAEMWTRDLHHHTYQKHIDRCDLSVCEQVLEFKTITIRLVRTHEQLADCFTKSLPIPAFRRNVEQLLG